jgi:hypothetical protein
MRFQGSTKFIAVVLVGIVAVWAGFKIYANVRLSGIELTPIEPGRINIVAISPAVGYKIVVANQIAYLAKVEGGLEVGSMDSGSENLSGASRLPLRELIQTLQGDEAALGVLVMRINDMPETDTAATAKVWRSEDIQAALDGDKDMESRLVADLNVTLDGAPLDTINLDAIMGGGILIDFPVALDVRVGDVLTPLTGRVKEVYQPSFCSNVERRISERFKGAEDRAYIQGIYREEAQAIHDGARREDVRSSLSTRLSKDRSARLAVEPKKVLDNTHILLNESHITSASYKNYTVSDSETSNDISIGLTDAGRMRLWKYSHDNRGFQLLFVVDTIAIAAPRISTELAESTITINRVPSKELVADAVALLNEIISVKK